MRVSYLFATLLSALVLSAPAAAQVPPPAAAAEATPAAEVAALAPAPAPVSPQLTREDLEAWLDGFMPYALGRGNIAGGIVVVVKDGQVLLQKGFGYADVEKKLARRPGARRSSARARSRSCSPGPRSCSWSSSGKIDLDADINQYLDFKIPPGPDGEPITMRNLMTHTAGFEEQVKELISEDPSRLQTIEATLKQWVPDRIFKAGTTPAYSNYGTALAGHIVERVSGLVVRRLPRPEHLRPARHDAVLVPAAAA